MAMFGYSADAIIGHCLSELHSQTDDSGEYLQRSSGLPSEALRNTDN